MIVRLATLIAAGWLWGAAPATAETLAVTHARLLPMTGQGEIPDATIVIRDGRIAAVGRDIGVPGDARVIDAGGRWVTPGLVSPATQLGLIEVGSVADTDDRSAAAGELGAGFDVQYALDPNSVLVDMARADGLTRAVVFPEASARRPYLGQGATISLSGGPDLLDVPRVAVFAKLGGANTGESGRSRAEDWQRLRRDLAQAGGDGKGDAGPDAEALEAVAHGKRPLAIFTERESDIREAIALKRDLGVEVVLLGAPEAWRAADALAQAGIPVILDPAAAFPMSFDEFGTRPGNAARLIEAGVPVAFYVSGADMSYNAGLALREAAGIAWSHGLSRERAMAAITIGAARIWGQAGRYGSIETGKAADLVIWDGDPLEPASAPVHVLIDGRPASLETRQSELAQRYHPDNEAEADR